MGEYWTIHNTTITEQRQQNKKKQHLFDFDVIMLYIHVEWMQTIWSRLLYYSIKCSQCDWVPGANERVPGKWPQDSEKNSFQQSKSNAPFVESLALNCILYALWRISMCRTNFLELKIRIKTSLFMAFLAIKIGSIHRITSMRLIPLPTSDQD